MKIVLDISIRKTIIITNKK